MLVLLMVRNESKVPSGGIMCILSSCFKKMHPWVEMLLGCCPGISFLLLIYNVIIVSREVCILSSSNKVQK
jgi:hypothetical protein